MARSCFLFLLLPFCFHQLRASDTLIIGRNLLEIGQAQTALQLSNQLLSTNLHDTLRYEAMTLKANAYREIGQLDTALKLHQEVLELRENYFGKQHPLVANVYHNIGNVYFEKANFETANISFQKAKNLREHHFSSDDISLVSIYNSLAETYMERKQLDSATYYVDRVLKIQEQSNSESYINSVLTQASLLKAQAHFKKAEGILRKALNDDKASPIQRIRLHINLGDCKQAQGAIQAAINNYQQALNRIEGLDLSPEIATKFENRIFINLGSAYEILGDAEEAETYYNRVGKLKNWKEEVTFKNNLALYYQSIGQLDKVQQLQEEAMLLVIEQKNTLWYAGMCQNQASHWLARYDATQDSSNIEDAQYYLNEAIKNHQLIPNTEAVQAACFSLLGDCSLRKAEYSEAIQYYQKAKQLNRSAKAIYQFKLGKVAYFQGQYNKALTYYQAIDTTHILYKSIQLDVALAQSASWYALAEQQKQKVAWQQALKQYQNTRWLLLQQQQLFQEAESGIYLRDRYYLVYDGLIATCFALSEYDTNYQQLAFQYMQESKADILRKRLERNAIVPDSLLEQERFLQQRILAYKNERLGQWRTEKQTDALQDLYEDLNSLQSQIANLYAPDDKATTTSIAAIQQRLSEAQTLIEYHISKDAIFVVTFSKHAFEAYSFPKSPQFELDVIELCQSIRAYGKDSTYADYHRLAYQLHQELIAPLKDLTKELIIVPSGVLRYLPFEALLTAPTEAGLEYRFDKCAYLIQDFDISYAHRMDLWHTAPETTSSSNRLLTIAPTFQANDSRNLRPLKHSQSEAKAIHQLLGGELWLDKMARASSFQKACSDYSLLHLSTHGVLNTTTPEASFLAFTEVEGEQKNQISVADIYYLNIVANLVVLSACETQLGKNIQGEGLLSMARAFTAAGAKSVVASLWSIQDAATNTLMTHFYENLQNLPKNKALSQAKRDYLAQLDRNKAYLSHPYLWSACVLIGDVNGVDLPPTSSHWFWYLLGFFFLLLIGFFFGKRKYL